MKYVDGCVLPIAAENLDTYREIARQAGEIWREHGALEFIECVGDDLEVKDVVPFPKLAGCQSGETVVFSWIVYKSREHRDEVNRKVMADPRIKEMGPDKVPFDCSRMAYGGFSTLVDL